MSKPGEKYRLNEDHGRKQSSSLANGMDSHPGCGSAEKRGHHCRSYKLIIDPALKKGSHKLYRYDGLTFNMPNPGMPPVDMVRDPRIGRLWTKYKETDLPVPTFKIDECYIGDVPPKEVTFARLNDNIREGFLSDMCKKFGEIEHVEILYNPKNKKHLGIAKVVFENVKAAKVAVQSLHKTSVMGNFIHVELDPKGENRLRYFQLLMNGSYTPLTLPVGGEEVREVSPRSLAEALLACEPIRRLSESSVSAAGGALPPSSSTTPLSQETGYSSLRQDTPQSQGTPHTPRQTGTPFSQDSNFSSRQSTPAYQSSRAENSGSYKSRRHESKFQDAYNRRPERPKYRSNMFRGNASDQAPFKQNQLTPPEPPPSTPTFAYTAPPPATSNFKSAFSPYQAPLPPAFPPSEPAFHHPAQREGEYLRPPQPPPAAATDFLPVKERPETPPIPEPPPEPVPHPTTPPPQTPEHCPSPGSPTLDLERNSLDSRIEMLLKEKKTKLPFLEERDSDSEVRMEGSPISSSSSQLSPIPPYTGGQQNSRPCSTGLEDISPTPLPDSEDEEPIPGTASLIKRISSPLSEKMSNSDLNDRHFRCHTPTDQMETGHQSSGEDMEISDDEMPGTPIEGAECKGIVMNSAVSEMQTIALPPPYLQHQSGYQLSHHHLPPHSAVPGHPHLTGVPHHMLHPMGPFAHSMMPLVQMELMNCLRWEQWSTVPMSFQMQQQMLSRMAQTRGPFPYPHYIDSGASGPYAAPYVPLSMGATPEDPHKATVDGVLLVIVKELKAIMKRDLNRKMVEVVAFRAFDDWWEKKEHSAKPGGVAAAARTVLAVAAAARTPQAALHRTAPSGSSAPLTACRVRRGGGGSMLSGVTDPLLITTGSTLTNSLLKCHGSGVSTTSSEDCKRKWKNMRDRYLKEVRMEIKSKKQGEFAHSRWKYREIMNFIAPFTGSRSGVADINDNDHDNADESGSVEGETSPPEAIKTLQSALKVNMNTPDLKPPVAFMSQLPLMSQEAQMAQLAVLAKMPLSQHGPSTSKTGRKRRLMQESLPLSLSPIAQSPTKWLVKDNGTVFPNRPRDEDELFLLSFVPALKRLAPQKRCETKIKIQQIMYEAEFNIAQPQEKQSEPSAQD
ncbi:hypothetical protein KUCAC02_008967 [Chaenocephalus aceratus]|uniref:Uncharacterized protein n=1 Tax=Chaenocephalus aceratus TaxID=36190 RepID=A0ACB9WTM7_CHAAC|nr:hypothetical protein KUCAC02_008967 [Chaenocephalus aceratus]